MQQRQHIWEISIPNTRHPRSHSNCELRGAGPKLVDDVDVGSFVIFIVMSQGFGSSRIIP